MEVRTKRVNVEKKGPTIAASHVAFEGPHNVPCFFGRSIKPWRESFSSAGGSTFIGEPKGLIISGALIGVKIIPASRNNGPEIVMEKLPYHHGSVSYTHLTLPTIYSV